MTAASKRRGLDGLNGMGTMSGFGLKIRVWTVQFCPWSQAEMMRQAVRS